MGAVPHNIYVELRRGFKTMSYRDELQDCTLNGLEIIIQKAFDDRDRYRKALEKIITPNQSSEFNCPVLKSDGEMLQIAHEALR